MSSERKRETKRKGITKEVTVEDRQRRVLQIVIPALIRAQQKRKEAS